MEDKEEAQEYKEGFLEIGDTVVGLYKIEGVLLKTERHMVYSVSLRTKFLINSF